MNPLVFVSALGALGTAAGAPSTVPATLDALTGPALGSAAPAFDLKTIDGQSVSLDTFKGRTLVINVWATWCPPCRQEMPDLIAIAPKLAKTNVAVLGVDTTEEAPVVRAYASSKTVPYPLAIDGDKSFEKSYDVQYFPTTFVIDPQGILRARYIDVIGPTQLNVLVAAAKEGKTAEIASPLQQKIDGILSDPSISYTGDAASVEANAKKADDAIAAAEKALDESDAAKGQSTDLLRTRAEEATLRDAAIAALVNVGTSVHDTSLLPRLHGDAARDRELWQDALSAYRAALAIDPKNEDTLSGIALSASRLEKYDDAVDAEKQLAALEPDDPHPLVELALTQAKAGHAEDAYATFDKAIGLAQKQLDANPAKAEAIRTLAWADLYAGRTYAKNGDPKNARAHFGATLALAEKLPPDDSRHDMYLEEAQEATVALGLAAPSDGPAVSLAPWTGADLPGSVPNTIKYRLIVAGVAGRNVALKTADVPKGWVASFCTDKICAPFKVNVAIPDSGVKVVEFQLVPPQSKSATPRVRVIGSDGQHESTATT
jgi:peroxiredoxin/Flp pilus assembly protein TadD